MTVKPVLEAIQSFFVLLGKAMSFKANEALPIKTTEDKSLREDLGRVFPSYADRGEERGAVSEFSGCEEKGELLKKLRKWALLNPARERLKILSCIYKEAGFSKNGEALDKLALALETEAEVRTELSAEVGKEEPVSYDMLRLMLGMGGFVEEFTDSELKRGLGIALVCYLFIISVHFGLFWTLDTFSLKKKPFYFSYTLYLGNLK